MIVLWSEVDVGGKGPEEWLDERIVRIDHQRESIPSHVKTTVDRYDDQYKGQITYKKVYNHYVCLRQATSHVRICVSPHY
jgi:hypothetical protein